MADYYDEQTKSDIELERQKKLMEYQYQLQEERRQKQAAENLRQLREIERQEKLEKEAEERAHKQRQEEERLAREKHIEEQRQIVLQRHPDAGKIFTSEKFGTWLSRQNRFIQGLADSDRSNDLSLLLELFKRHNQKKMARLR